MPGDGKKHEQGVKNTFLERLTPSLYGCIFSALMLGYVVSGCAARTVSVQPEIKSTAKDDSLNYERMKAVNATGETLSDLPEMNAASHEALGDALMAQGEFQSAHNHYKEAMEKTSSRDRTRLEYKQGLAFLYADKYDAALACFESVLELDPDYAAAYQGIGQVYLQQGDMEGAKIQFQKAVSLNADLWQSQNSLGTIYDNEGALELAENAYKNALAVMPLEGSVLNNLGASYLLADKNELAVHTFELAIQGGFTEDRVFNNLGLALARAGRFDEALQAFTKAGGEAAAYNNLGCVHLKNGRRNMAIECFEKAIALDPIFYVTANENLKKANMSKNAEIGGVQ